MQHGIDSKQNLSPSRLESEIFSSRARPCASSTWVPYLVLLIVVVTWFSPWIFSDRVLAPFDILTEMLQPWRSDKAIPEVHNHYVADAVTQYIPYRLFAEKSFREDGYIGWNPMLFGGTAQYADTMGTYFDWSVQLHRFLDFWQAWHIGLMAQFLIAGTGMLIFLRSRGCPPQIATIAAIAYMGNSQFFIWVYHRWALGSFCWAPWILWAFERWSGGDRRFAAVLPIFVGLSFLGGSLQHSAFVAVLIFCLGVGLCVERRFRGPQFLRLLGIFSVWGILAGGLTVFALYPTIRAYFENNTAGHSRGGLGYEFGLLQPVLNLVSYPFYVWPTLLGSPQTLDLWKGFKSGAMNVGFFGTLPVIIAILACFSRRIPVTPKILCVAGLLIPLTPLVGPLYHRVNILWIVGGCWACAEYLRRLNLQQAKRLARTLLVFLAGFVGLWAVASIGISVFNDTLSSILINFVRTHSADSQFGYFQDWLVERAASLPAYLLLWNWFHLAEVLTMIVAVIGLRFITKPIGGYTISIAVAAQLTLFWFQWTTWSPSSLPYAANPLVEVLKAEPYVTRLVSPDVGKLPISFAPPNTLDPVGVPISGGYDSIHPLGMKKIGEPDWSFPGASHYLARKGGVEPLGWLVVSAWDNWKLFRKAVPPEMGTGLSEDRKSPVIFQRTSLNTAKVSVTPGTEIVSIYENFNPGWQWKLAETADPWQSVESGPNHTISIHLSKIPATRSEILLRFQPFQQGFALSVTLVFIFLLFLLPKLPCMTLMPEKR